MPVRSPEYLTTTLKQLDILVKPDVGGRYENNRNLDETLIIANPSDRISSATESQKPRNEPIELVSDLVVNKGLRTAKWDSLLEMRRFMVDINVSLASDKSLSEAANFSAGEVELNIRSYDAEITRQSPFLVHHNKFGEWNGERRIVGNNGRPVVDAITAQERNGSVIKATHSIENFLLSAPENSYSVLISPAGWNGFIDDNGRELAHLNSQIMIFWKDKAGELKGGTIVVDLSEAHARELMISLGVREDVLQGSDAKERLVNIVANPALLSFARSDITPFEFILDRMLSVRGNADFRLLQRDGTVEIRSAKAVREDIRRFDALLKLGEEEERLVAAPRQFILGSIDRLRERYIQQELIYKMEEAILLLTRKYLIDTNRLVFYQFKDTSELSYSSNSPTVAGNFSAEIMFLQTRNGCPPSGGSLGVMILSGISLGQNIGGAVYFSFGGETGKKGKSCIGCGEVNYCTEKCYKCGGMLI